jgi:hypothetical protein
VFENGAQDNSGAWIAAHHPKIAWHRSNHQTYAYGGPGGKDSIQGPYTWEPYERTADGQHEWAKQHIMNNHGDLGACFPPRRMGRLHFLEGGGTIPWMGLVNRGLADPERLDWGGWSGRFSRMRHRNVYSRHQDVRRDEEKYGDFSMFEADSEVETWTDPVHNEIFSSHYVPVWRFRRAMFHDFQARMDWCVKPYDQANHNPQAAFRADGGDAVIRLKAVAGESVGLDAAASADPDGDELDITWWVYREAGTYDHEIAIPRNTAAVTSLILPADASGSEIHIILEVQDRSEIVSLYDYRRIVLDVE